jgi:hypothetical protein
MNKGYKNAPDVIPQVGDIVLHNCCGETSEVRVAAVLDPPPEASRIKMINCVFDEAGMFLNVPEKIEFVRREVS